MLSHYASGNEGPMCKMGGLQSKPIYASWYPVPVKTEPCPTVELDICYSIN